MRICPRSSCDVMVAGCLWRLLPHNNAGSISALRLVEAPEIPASCLEQTAVRSCMQCYLEYKDFSPGDSETRMKRYHWCSSLYSEITSSFLRTLEKNSVYVSWRKVHSSQACLFLWDNKHSQEVVVLPSVDINTMNMRASYLHTLQ